MQDLKSFGVSVLILSGGEPLLRPDIFEVSARAKEMGFYVGLSSNGTLITEQNISDIERIGYDYVGVAVIAGCEIELIKVQSLGSAYICRRTR